MLPNKSFESKIQKFRSHLKLYSWSYFPKYLYITLGKLSTCWVTTNVRYIPYPKNVQTLKPKTCSGICPKARDPKSRKFIQLKIINIRTIGKFRTLYLNTRLMNKDEIYFTYIQTPPQRFLSPWCECRLLSSRRQTVPGVSFLYKLNSSLYIFFLYNWCKY